VLRTRASRNPTGPVWVVVLGGSLAVDLALLRYGHDSLTAWARAHPRTTTATMMLVGAHFAGRLGRFDPFDRSVQALARVVPPPARRMIEAVADVSV
jgi:TRAP-type C4-dicarboxylate transport system permease small subunit